VIADAIFAFERIVQRSGEPCNRHLLFVNHCSLLLTHQFQRLLLLTSQFFVAIATLGVSARANEPATQRTQNSLSFLLCDALLFSSALFTRPPSIGVSSARNDIATAGVGILCSACHLVVVIVDTLPRVRTHSLHRLFLPRKIE
jgi:hypothetical protein